MDCASCAVTVEKRVGQLPGVRRAVVNFASGRLDAEHDPGLTLEEIEKAVRDAGYGVAKTEEVESTPFWRTPRALSVFASALLFALGLALGLSGAPEFARGGRLPRGHRGRWVADLPGGRGRLEGEAPGHERLDERSHSGCSGDRGVGGGRLGGGPLRRRERSAGLRHRQDARGREGAGAPSPERGPRQEGRHRGRRPGWRGRSRRYGGREARREARCGWQGHRGLLGGGRGPCDGRERTRGEGTGRRGVLGLPERPGWAASRGDQAGRGLDAAGSHAS